jgi:hypothetical protein
MERAVSLSVSMTTMNWIPFYPEWGNKSLKYSCLSFRSVIRIFLLVLLVLFTAYNHSFAQEEDSKKPKKEKKVKKKDLDRDVSPHKATLWALIPGAGQIYNRKYWKLPIVYAGFAVTGYFAITNRQEYLKYRDAYICAVNGETDTTFTCEDPLALKYPKENLANYSDYYRRNMELSYILMGVWYILTILDATVDAHLYYWDVNDNLSLKVEPIYQPVFIPTTKPSYNGLRLTLRF